MRGSALWRDAAACGRGARARGRTALVVQLAKHFSDDLAHALQRLQVVLRLVKLLARLLHLLAQRAHAGVQLLRPPRDGRVTSK